MWLGDGTERTLRVAVVMPIGTGDNGVHVTSANAPGAPVGRLDVTVTTGADALWWPRRCAGRWNRPTVRCRTGPHD